tara:strand:+ start:2005 stop:2619 length:615 start_codon:yes stop_codon:yes gene_type:complete
LDPYDDETAWHQIDPKHLWVLDKLILSKHLRYNCGPVGADVEKPGYYIVRPCVNALGLGLCSDKVWIEKDTDDLTPGHFWCEWFDGRHFSVDYEFGKTKMIIEGFKKENTFTRWDKWAKVDDFGAVEKMLSYPKILEPFKKYPQVNVEFIGSKIIEVHFRGNPDFKYDNKEFIPVWEGQDTTPPEGYRYVKCKEIHGRIGAFIC